MANIQRETLIRMAKGVGPESIDAISSSTANEAFLTAMTTIVKSLVDEVTMTEEETTAIVETPRGGSWASMVAAIQEKLADAEFTTANTSSTERKLRLPLLPQDFPVVDHYIIPDGIMATGGTMVEIIEAIRAKCQLVRGKNFEPRFSILCPIVYKHRDQMNNKLYALQRALKAKGINVQIEVIAGAMEKRGQYIKFNKQQPPQIVSSDEPGAVLVVGEITSNDQNQVTGISTGDYGDMYQEAHESGVTAQLYGLSKAQIKK